jgi:three-Cys-motif partner protein
MNVELYAGREQTEVKHRILERYLSAFAPIVGNWAADIAYIDCLAGPWEARGKFLEDTSFTRSISVLREAKKALVGRGKTPSFRCLLVENDPENFKRLSAFVSTVKDIEVTAKPWDFADHIDDVVRFATERRNSFPFFFIDPKGWELVAIDLIKPILGLHPGEVLINLMTSWIRRFLSDESKHFERLLGPNVGNLRQLTGDEQEEELVRCYANSVKVAGKFNYVCTLPVLKADADMIHFWMVYGTRHPKGVEEFKRTENVVIPFMHQKRALVQQRRKFVQSGGQFSLYEAEATYVERRLTRLEKKNLAAARAYLKKRLEKAATLTFDEAWAATMQFSLVAESNLKDWIKEWVDKGDVELLGLKPGEKSLKRKAGHLLKWVRKTSSGR